MVPLVVLLMLLEIIWRPLFEPLEPLEPLLESLEPLEPLEPLLKPLGHFWSHLSHWILTLVKLRSKFFLVILFFWKHFKILTLAKLRCKMSSQSEAGPMRRSNRVPHMCTGVMTWSPEEEERVDGTGPTLSYFILRPGFGASNEFSPVTINIWVWNFKKKIIS